jgi:uncharacterized protein
MDKCAGCPITKLCGLCFSFAETNGEFAKPAGWCETQINMNRNDLADYISMLEANARLEHKWIEMFDKMRRDRMIFQS